MWIMGDVIEQQIREFDAHGLDQYGRPKGGSNTVTTTTNVSNGSNSNIDIKTDNLRFPFSINHAERIKQNAGTMINITLTDEQFEKLLDTIKSLYNENK